MISDMIWAIGVMRLEFARREVASIITDFLVAMAVARRGKFETGATRSIDFIQGKDISFANP